MPAVGEAPTAPRRHRVVGDRGERREVHRLVFVGVHDRQLDDKGRCALPATYRGALGERCYLSLGDDGCVTVRAVDEFEAHARELIEREKAGAITLARRRQIATNSAPAAIDKQGRITLDERFRAHAGLVPGAPVVVAGNFDTIEIWKPARYATIDSEGRSDTPGRQWGD